MIQVALFASGQGSNALHLLETAQSFSQLKIPLVIVDQVASALPTVVKAKYPEVTVAVIERMRLADKNLSQLEHEQKIIEALDAHQIDWCFLAGYMRIVGPLLLQKFTHAGLSRIVNIHPSLLPAYPGLDAYGRAFAANEKICGATIHFVDGGIDTGALIAQKSFERLPHENLDEFTERGKKLEWQLYADVLTTLHREGDLRPMRNK